MPTARFGFVMDPEHNRYTKPMLYQPSRTNNPPWQSHKAQEGTDGPLSSSGLGYKGSGSAEPVLCLTTLFIPCYPMERGTIPQMPAKLLMLYKYTSNK